MSFSRAMALLRQMTPVQRQILDEQRTEMTAPPAEWLATLAPLAAYAAAALPARRRLAIVATWAALGFILGFILQHTAVGLPLIVLGLGIASGASVARRRLVGSQGQLLGRVERVVLPVVRVLQQDMQPAEPLRLRIDVPTGNGKQLGEARQLPGPFANPRLKGVEETLYRQAWMEADARLADGGLLHLDVVDLLRQRKISKRGASGKTKTAIKVRRRRQIAARLALRADRYGVAPAGTAMSTGDVDPAGAGARGGAVIKSGTVQVVAGERRHVLKVRRVIEPPPQPQVGDAAPLLAAIGSLYGRAIRRRAVRDPRGGPRGGVRGPRGGPARPARSAENAV